MNKIFNLTLGTPLEFFDAKSIKNIMPLCDKRIFDMKIE
jgi:hypothetical protein